MDNDILVIDDDAELCSEMSEFLRSSGYLVENTPSSSEGSILIENKDFRIVILDFKMPGLDGIDLLKKVKRKTPETSVFFISGMPSLEKMLKEKNLMNQVEAIISKPFKDTELLEKIQKICPVS